MGNKGASINKQPHPGTGPIKGRGATSNPQNRFESVHLHVLDESIEQTSADHGPDEARPATEILPDRSRTFINTISADVSSDIGFGWSINPYRGCEHGCVYCYARPTHEYLGYNCGMDFETRIMAKFDAPDMLRRELAHKSWRGEPIMISGVTDGYQPIESKLRITGQCLEIFAQCRQPVAIVTKNKLILRDLKLLQELARYQAVRVAISVTTLDPRLASMMEPRTSSPANRLQAIRQLSAAGVPVIAMVAPVIPGLNDKEIPAILKAVADAGARAASYVLLRLPGQLKQLFKDWLEAHHPLRADHIESLIRSTHHGQLYDSTPGIRMRGQGPVADQIRSMFRTFTKRYKLNSKDLPPLSSAAFRPPCTNGQKYLF